MQFKKILHKRLNLNTKNLFSVILEFWIGGEEKDARFRNIQIFRYNSAANCFMEKKILT